MNDAQQKLNDIIVESAQATWSAFFDGRLDIVDTESRVVSIERSDWLTAKMHVTGNWSATISLYTELPAARLWTAEMLAQDSGQCSNLDIADAAGELVNVIAGGVKRALDRPVKFSRPMVEVKMSSLEPRFKAHIAQVTFASTGCRFGVVIGRLERRDVFCIPEQMNNGSHYAFA